MPPENSGSSTNGPGRRRANDSGVWPLPGGPAARGTCQRGALIMKVQCRLFAILAASWLLAVSALGEAVPAAANKTAVEKGFTLTETYEGSADTDGFISDINSLAGYVFNPHFSINMGVSYLFVNPST